jgi:hypothetical protein
MDEKRRYPRVNVTILIKFKSHSEDKLREGESKDISEGGICIKSKTEYSPGDIVNLQLFLGDTLVCVEGRIVWKKHTRKGKFELGIEYIKVNKTDIDIIKKYIE